LLFKEKKHILSSSDNALLSKISINNPAVHSIFSTLVDGDIKFDNVVDAKNKLHELPTSSAVFLNLKSNDQILRKNTWISYHQAFAKFESTLTQTLYYNYLKLNTYAKLHNYKDYIDRTCNDDEINQNFITNLYAQVINFKIPFLQYKKITSTKLKEKLKLTKLEP
jgi:oligoendopeptidase F